MRICNTGPTTMPAAEAASAGHETKTSAPAAGVTVSARQSALLQPAKEALREMPEIDLAKVTALREALARGEIGLDTERLAEMIERYHMARG